MDPEKKTLWVTALRSGEYQQGTGNLHRTQGEQHFYCCLGVLCDVALKSGLGLSRTNRNGCTCPICVRNQTYSYDGCKDFLPPSVVTWAGLATENPPTSILVEGTYAHTTLSYLNDNGKTFAEIADIIEREF